MKKTMLTLILSVIGTFLPTQTLHANDGVSRLAVSLCDFAKADDRTSMRRKLKAVGIKLRQVYSTITCGNEGSLLRVATNNEAIKAAQFLASNAGKENLKKQESDGKNILEWTKELVANGDTSKQPFVELFESKMY